MATPTRTSVARRQLLKGATALGALAALQTIEGTPAPVPATAAAGPSLVGSWMLHITEADGTVSMDLASFGADGLVIDAGAVPLTAPPKGQGGPPSVGLGRWALAMGGGYGVTFVSLGAQPNGALAGIVTITAHLALGADGASLSGPFTLTGRAGGKVLFTSKGTVKGTRIKVAAM